MAHAVGDHQGDVVDVDGVVEAVPCDRVRGLEGTGERERVAFVGEHREQLPLDLGGQLERAAPAHALEQIGVAAGGDDDVRDDGARLPEDDVVASSGRDRQHHLEQPQPLGAHGDGHEHPVTTIVVDDGDPLEPVGAGPSSVPSTGSEALDAVAPPPSRRSSVASA